MTRSSRTTTLSMCALSTGVVQPTESSSTVYRLIPKGSIFTLADADFPCELFVTDLKAATMKADF